MNRTPYEAWKGRKPRVSHLVTFGSIAYVLDKSLSRNKLDKKSQKCIFSGYCPQSKAYRLYNPESGKIMVSRDVKFNEAENWVWNDSNDATEAPQILEDNPATPEAEPFEQVSPNVTGIHNPSPGNNNATSPATSSPENSDDETPHKIRSLSEVYNSCNFALYSSDPVCYEDAQTTKCGRMQ